ncbi:MAG: hypothetical protein QOE58_2823, partial [Actinomycetota bacterium]|nr:hypothetical protein [Actinomycetota bacterium]
RGPLPWLPSVPARIAGHERYGPYLAARADLVAALVVDVRAEATQLTPTTAPPWAVHMMDPAHTSCSVTWPYGEPPPVSRHWNGAPPARPSSPQPQPGSSTG